MNDPQEKQPETCEQMGEQLGLPGCRTVREHLGFTQEELADQAGCHVNFINGLECGRRDCSMDVQRRIARTLCCKVADLLEPPDEERLRQIAINRKRLELKQLEAGEQGVA